VHLYRYSIKNVSKIELSEIDYLVKFPKYHTTKEYEPTKVLYVTTFQSNDANDLNNRLSITYYPQYRLRVNETQTLKLINNAYEQIESLDDLSKITRTWPAFGKDGGVPEILIIDPDSVTFNDSYFIENGGAFEFWHQDNVKNIPLSIAIGAIMSRTLASIDGFRPGDRGLAEGSYLGQVKDDGNIIVNSSYNGAYVTLSAAYEFIAGILYVKIWAAYWKEKVEDKVRYLWYESTDPIKILPCELDDYPYCIHFYNYSLHNFNKIVYNRDNFEPFLREYYRDFLQNQSKYYAKLLQNYGSYSYFQIFDAIARLLEKIKSMSPGFFASHSKCIFIP